MDVLYDAIIVGAGPAGLSAGIYLGRFNRKVLLLGNEEGRWNTQEINENYLGFPNGISTKKLRSLGLEQAKKYGATYEKATVTDALATGEQFVVKSSTYEYVGKTVILATGVKDIWPQFAKYKEYIGKSIFWCITCDGYKTCGKKIAIIGNTDDAVCTATQFLNFTNNIVFITNAQTETISPTWKKRLEELHIPFIHDLIVDIKGHDGNLEELVLRDGSVIPVDFLFSEQGSVPKSELAIQLGVTVGPQGYILTDIQQRTNIPRVYAAGDVTKPFEQQIITAAHEGATAATTANYDLYTPLQKM